MKKEKSNNQVLRVNSDELETIETKDKRGTYG